MTKRVLAVVVSIVVLGAGVAASWTAVQRVRAEIGRASCRERV